MTVAAGLAEPISIESAGWGDYDNDGKVDLFVCGEYTGKTPDPRCRSRLYHNQGNGTFVNVSNMDGRCRLFHNEGHSAFLDVAAETGITRTSNRPAVRLLVLGLRQRRLARRVRQ